ncbi:histidine phosphatase family protein [Evansella halocellulosilytica]|uniref:histidine phosphatase family protein n=1 Tax=Evansella halocellulosilytica TaxID=2011013 RepID=UPI001155C889|nr:histidine phosphatase family protein [Evansella halocellulosilytica]
MVNQQNIGVTGNSNTNSVGVTNGYNSLPKKRSLLNSLREGGYILFARHAEATIGEDQWHLDFNDCSTQRNLSYNGRRQAVAYGEAIRRLQIPIQSPVLASPFCRNVETAALAFGETNVRIDPFGVEIYYLSANLSLEQQQRILHSLNSILETAPLTGHNQVIISHSFPEGIGLGRIPNMGTVVLEPLGQGNRFEVITRLSLPEVIGMVE